MALTLTEASSRAQSRIRFVAGPVGSALPFFRSAQEKIESPRPPSPSQRPQGRPRHLDHSLMQRIAVLSVAILPARSEECNPDASDVVSAYVGASARSMASALHGLCSCTCSAMANAA